MLGAPAEMISTSSFLISRRTKIGSRGSCIDLRLELDLDKDRLTKLNVEGSLGSLGPIGTGRCFRRTFGFRLLGRCSEGVSTWRAVLGLAFRSFRGCWWISRRGRPDAEYVPSGFPMSEFSGTADLGKSPFLIRLRAGLQLEVSRDVSG